MPYTPPAHSPSATPSSSRSSSFSHNDSHTGSTINLLKKNNPPRSTTYLHKYRRNSSGSLPASTILQQCVPPKPTEKPPTSTDTRPIKSVHQSPRPVNDGSSMMPTGATFSPPDSALNSSDDEDIDLKRLRDLGRLEHELKEIIMNLPKGRSSSPDSSVPRSLPPAQHSNDAPPRGRTLRMHNRTQSYPSLLVDITSRPRSGSNSSNDSMEDDAVPVAPAMVRKKSGEVVKSSLKSPSRSRPCSVPSTPTFPKNVHFDSRIEHVRHFLHFEKPSAVSVGSSPVEASYEDFSEYPFGHEVEEPEWEIQLPNFPKNLDHRKSLPVRLEKLCLSTDKRNLIGTVAVINISFQKHVVTRFTFDYWQTVSEVAADWSSDVRRKDREDGVDRFVFKIKLTEQANLEKKTLFFCVRYNSGGQEFWDNNGGVNFQVDFKKSTPCMIGGAQLRGLPRSKPSTPNASRSPIPNMDEYSILDDAFFARIKELGMSPTTVPTLKQNNTVFVKDDSVLPAGRTNPTGNAFGNRYDFRTSLSAAMKGSSAPGFAKNSPPKTPELTATRPSDGSYFSMPMQNRKHVSQYFSTTPMDTPSVTGAGPPEIFNQDNFWITEGDKPSIESPSYRQLIDNYCFFGSSKSTTKSDKPTTEMEIDSHKNKEQLSQKAFIPQSASSHSGSQSLSVAQHKTSGNPSPIQLNFAGYHHQRRGSGAFRFDATQTPTAIC